MTTIFNHAINEEWRLDNPARNSLDTSLPHRSKVVVHHRSLPYAHVTEVMSKVREYHGEPASRLGLEFLVTTNLPFDEWTGVFGSERLTGALLDRLTHHVHILEMNGESYRLKRSRKNVASQVPDDPDEE